MACKELGIAPDFVDVDLDGMSPVDYVLSLNLKRRHLGETGRAHVAVAVKELEAKDAKRRQRIHGNTAPGRKKTLPVNSPEVNNGDSRDKAGKKLNVSGSLVDAAEKVQKKGAKSLVKASELTW